MSRDVFDARKDKLICGIVELIDEIGSVAGEAFVRSRRGGC